MFLKNSLILINEFFYSTKNQIKKLYLKSAIYNNKISKIEISNLTYKPSLSILSCLVKYDKKNPHRRNYSFPENRQTKN